MKEITNYSGSNFGNSAFWLGGRSASTESLIQLASAKRSIANFVSIVTKKAIPVEFINENGTSCTDGKTVIISSSLKDSTEFDSTVGLALHEGSHIILSNFRFLEVLKDQIKQYFGSSLFTEFETRLGNMGCDLSEISRDLLNVIEDRRVVVEF